MRNKFILKIGLITSALIFLLSVFLDPSLGGACRDIECMKFLTGSALVLMLSYSAVFTVIFFVLLFSNSTIFQTWLKFAAVYIPLAAILFFIAPTDNADLYGLDSELIAWFTSGLFFVISLLIIIIKWFRSRGHST